MKRSIMAIVMSFILLLGFSVKGEAAPIIVSPNKTTELGGLEVHKGDMVEYYADTDTAKLIFDGNNFENAGQGENIDAYADNLGYDANGDAHLLISTSNRARLGGVTFRGGDLVEVAYNYATNTVTSAEIFLSRHLFSRPRRANIDAVWYLPDTEEVVLSTSLPERLGGLSFKNGDLIKYDPAADTATLLFDQNLFLNPYLTNLNAVQCLSDNKILLSTLGGATLGGLTFNGGDVVKYNLLTDEATLHFDGSNFNSKCGEVSVTAIAPIPGAIWLLGSGILTLIGFRRKS